MSSVVPIKVLIQASLCNLAKELKLLRCYIKLPLTQLCSSVNIGRRTVWKTASFTTWLVWRGEHRCAVDAISFAWNERHYTTSQKAGSMWNVTEKNWGGRGWDTQFFFFYSLEKWFMFLLCINFNTYMDKCVYTNTNIYIYIKSIGVSWVNPH